MCFGSGSAHLLNLNLLSDAVHANAAALIAGYAVEALDGFGQGLVAETKRLMMDGQKAVRAGAYLPDPIPNIGLPE